VTASVAVLVLVVDERDQVHKQRAESGTLLGVQERGDGAGRVGERAARCVALMEVAHRYSSSGSVST
jgi:hypothetical protein